VVPPLTAPTLVSNTPLAGATGVAASGTCTATFSEAMDPATLTALTFTLATATGTAVPGTVTYANSIATFTPGSPLATGTGYTATVTTGAMSAAEVALAANATWSFTTASVAATAPTVVTNTPLNGANGVPLNASISATFSGPMTASTLSPATFTLADPGGAAITGTVTYANGTATFLPANPLLNNSTYTATITPGAMSAVGVALAASQIWSFTTVPAASATPTVLANLPLNNATGVAVTSTIQATFSEAMTPATLSATTFTLTDPSGTAVLGTVTYANAIATFLPTTALAGNTVYNATITTGAKSAQAVALAANVTWKFTTAVQVVVVPTVLSNTPLNAAINVVLTPNISATFSEAMLGTSLTATTFTLSSGAGVAVPGSVSYANGTAVFLPTLPLATSTLFTATITTGALSAASVPLAAKATWTFTTGTSALTELPVNLRSSGNYVILAKSGISTVPASAITGNLGLSPAAASYITGFSLSADATNVFATSPQVTGQIFAADYAVPTPSNLTTAVSDMLLAFSDAAGRAPDVTELGAGAIGGMTIAPGTYKWSSSVLISSNVTLSGGPTAVWIFQIAGNLTMGPATHIYLAGGAVAKNIFWQVSGDATLGTTAHLEGVVLSQTSIILSTGASANSRLLAQTDVNIDASTIVQPAP
jgi:hypothetical protein